jgi:hypothetical protein
MKLTTGLGELPMRSAFRKLAVLLALLWAGATDVCAGTIDVSVGYADGLRSNPFFPSPWYGSPNIDYFFGATSAVESGAIMLTNNTASAIVVSSLIVDGFENGAILNRTFWASFTLNPGKSAIFTGYNDSGDFDSSDLPIHPGPGHPGGYASPAQPQVHFVIDGVAHTYTDSGQVLNTGGFDTALVPLIGNRFDFFYDGVWYTYDNNESLQWRPIGTTGIDDPGGVGVPEPATAAILGTGILALAGYTWRRRKNQAA